MRASISAVPRRPAQSNALCALEREFRVLIVKRDRS